MPGDHEDPPEVDNPQIAQTREQLKAAQAALKKKAKAQQKSDEESAQLETLLEELRQKTEAANASKLRADNLRQQLMEFQENDGQDDDDDDVEDQVPPPETPMSRSDIGSIVAEMIQKTVSILCLGVFFMIIHAF